jgi:hypothetical protein
MTDERVQGQRLIPLADRFGRQLQKDGNIRSTVLSAAVHAGLVALLVWQTARQVRYYDASEAPGPGGRGGGGGGGNRTLVTMPILMRAFAPTPAPPPSPTPQLTIPQQVVPLPQPQPQPAAPAPDSAAATPVVGAGQGPGQGPGTGPGQGSGSGGGTGGGVGTGVGNDSGPGGGGGGSIFPPQPQGIILPPPGPPSSLRGVRLTVTFFISDRGEVDNVEVDPPIRDRGYRNEFMERMRRYTFTPAYTRDGRPVPARFPVHITL